MSNPTDWDVNVSRPLAERNARMMLDYGLSVIALPILALLCPIIKLANLVTGDTGLLFYRDVRYGRNRDIILVWKFRTLRCGCDQGPVLEGDERVTRVGRFLRATRLDELPQILNVLRGEMHVVGPRPLSVAHDGKPIEELHDEFAARFRVKPGITGYAHVSRRFRADSCERLEEAYREQFTLDAQYVHERSLWLDLKIIARTPYVMLARRGIR